MSAAALIQNWLTPKDDTGSASPLTSIPVDGPIIATPEQRRQWSAKKQRFDALAQNYCEWMNTSDRAPLQFMCGSYVANQYDADPIWPMIIGGPGSGKTELLRLFGKLPRVWEVSTLTEAALLSGVSKKDRADDATGGLLNEIGKNPGYIIAKDFGSILSMNRDTRAGLFAAFREIYDGAWTRYLGADGGKKLVWKGKVAFMCASTPKIDSYQSANASLGERFTYFRLNPADRPKLAANALHHIGENKDSREELALRAQLLLKQLPELPPVPECLSSRAKEQIARLADLASLARSAVERSNTGHEIIDVPEPEAPTRLASALGLLLGGMIALSIEDDDAWRVVCKVALDSIPPSRAAVLRILLSAQEDLDVATVKAYGKLMISDTTVRRVLEDLEAHGLVCCSKGQKNKDLWRVADRTREDARNAGLTCGPH